MTGFADTLHALYAGPLGRAGGVAVFEGLPDAATCAALAREAQDAYATSSRQDVTDDDHDDGRGGMPARALRTGSGGPVQDALYSAGWLSEFLTVQCGVPISQSGNRGSYSYYVDPGDFLAMHLDVETCDVTLITVLHDGSDPGSAAGALAVYPGRFGAPLTQIRAAPDDGVAFVKASAGQSIVLLGGLVPHQVLPLGPSGQRVISALCFSAGAP